MANLLVTFPRAGQHLVIGALFSYFDLPLTKYCEFYSCCLTFPCHKPGIFLHKNHDFKLLKAQRLPQITLKKEKCHKYIVGIRHPYDCLLSWYNLETSEYHTRPKGQFLSYLDDRMEYWKQFVDKWIINKSGNCHIFRYGGLIDDFVPQIASIIKFIKPSAQIDVQKLRRIKNTLDTFNYRKDDKRHTAGVARQTKRENYGFHSKEALDKLMATLGDYIIKTEKALGGKL